MPKFSPLLNSKAFSLVEIILIIAVSGLIIAVLANIPSSIKLIGSSNYESIAKQIALKNVEDTRSRTYDNLSNGTVAISDSRLLKIPAASGQIIIDDCPVAVCPNNELIKQVTININWTENSKPKNIKIVTLVAKGGLH